MYIYILCYSYVKISKDINFRGFHWVIRGFRMLLGFQPRYVFGIAAVDLIGKADYSGTEEVHGAAGKGALDALLPQYALVVTP